MKNYSRIRAPKIRDGQKDLTFSKGDFLKRFHKGFVDPLFENVTKELDAVAEVAWKSYIEYHKAPLQSPAGKGYADPTYELSDEWRATSENLKKAEIKQKSKSGKTRLLVISGSSRNKHTCPGETPKTYRLAESVKRIAENRGIEVDVLDLSEINVEFGKHIHPCKACVSTAMPLCHWPCSCYPNHALDQTKDWMADIYERWVLAHGVMIITPVHWYQAPSVLKLMMDRLVCADGGNPDPTLTQGKNAVLAKKVELAGWDYPKHLAGRVFSVVVHGDVTGAEGLRRNLVDWLCDMELLPAPDISQLDGYIGYNKTYATSHDEFDKDDVFLKRTHQAAEALIESMLLHRKGKWPAEKIQNAFKDPSPK